MNLKEGDYLIYFHDRPMMRLLMHGKMRINFYIFKKESAFSFDNSIVFIETSGHYKFSKNRINKNAFKITPKQYKWWKNYLSDKINIIQFDYIKNS